MAESDELVVTLKRALKANGKTYNDVAAALEVTPSTIKRVFSEKNLSLQRMEKICEVAAITLSDLFQSMHAARHKIVQLTVEQEREIADNEKLLLVLFLVLNKYTFDEILAGYRLSNTECIILLAKLDKIRLIELQPNNRIKLQVSSDFAWIPNGPIQTFFQKNFQRVFFDSRFTEEDELLIGINAMLSDESNAAIRKKLQALSAEFSQAAKKDSSRPIKEKQVNSLVLAVRAWQPPLFDDLRRNK